MNNTNSIRAYYDLRKNGASGGINCQKVLKSGGPEKANPFTLNACLGELKQQVGNISPNPQHDKQIEQITSKSNEEFIEQVKKDFATRENFKFKTEFLINDKEHIAFNQLIKKHDPNAKLKDFSIYYARNGKSEYWTLDIESLDANGDPNNTFPGFRISDHWVESGGQFSKSSIETRDPKYYGTIQLDEKEPGAETSYETLLTLVPYRNGMISRDQLDLVIKAAQEMEWDTPDMLESYIKEFNQKIIEQNKITISKQKEALLAKKNTKAYKDKQQQKQSEIKQLKQPIREARDNITKTNNINDLRKLGSLFLKEPKIGKREWNEGRKKLINMWTDLWKYKDINTGELSRGDKISLNAIRKKYPNFDFDNLKFKSDKRRSYFEWDD